MSKKNIDSICEIISSESHIIMRDMLEMERLQSAEIGVSEKFAVASYRKFAQKMISKIIDITAAYKIKLPKNVFCSYNGNNKLVGIQNILNTEEFDKIGDENIGCFFISPLDGLYNFTRTIPLFCTGIAIFNKNEDDLLTPHQAIVYEPMQNKFYTATANSGSYLSGVKLANSSRDSLQSSTVIVNSLEQTIKQNGAKPEIIKKANIIKNLTILAANSISGIPTQLACCYVASGKAEVLVETDLSDPVNIISGLMIAKESGCIICDETGKNLEIESIALGMHKTIIVCSRNIASSLIKILKQSGI